MRPSITALLMGLILTAPLSGQGHSIEVSLFGSAGWLEPTNTLASQDPRFFHGTARGAVEPGALIGLGVQADLPAPIPQLRLSAHYLAGSDLLLEDPNAGTISLGSMSVTTALLEVLAAPFRAGPVSAHAALGAGFTRYGFPAIPEEDVARLFEDGTTSTTVSVGLGLSWDMGRFTLVLDAADLISTFDSPPVETEPIGGRPVEVIDRDESQHDLRFTLGLRYPVWHP